jgi:hypothetical protein
MLPGVLLLLLVPVQEGAAPVARGKGGLTVGRAELETTLLERYAYSEDGRELLDLFLKSRLLDSLAAERGIRIGEGEVTRRWQELEEHARASGEKRGLAAELEKRRLTREQFREFLRLALVQERLTRAALGLPHGAEVSGDKQEIWLEQELGARGLELLPLSGSAAEQPMIARCGEIGITRQEFARFLHERLSRENVRETAWHLLLLRALDKRMPDLAAEARARAIEAEIERRRARHELEYPGIRFEQRLAATGRTLDGLRRDPSLAIAALTRLWVDRSQGPEGVRSTYERERGLFEARFGEALHAHLLLRVAGRFVNDLCPRTFEQAESELSKQAERCRSLQDFEALVERLSEEPTTRKQRGDLGWVTRGEPRVPAALREALFHFLDTGGFPADSKEGGSRPIGPVRLDGGVALLWVSARRPSPPWEQMSEHVHEELRRRLVEELMPLESVELLTPE